MPPSLTPTSTPLADDGRVEVFKEEIAQRRGGAVGRPQQAAGSLDGADRFDGSAGRGGADAKTLVGVVPEKLLAGRGAGIGEGAAGIAELDVADRAGAGRCGRCQGAVDDAGAVSAAPFIVHDAADAGIHAARDGAGHRDPTRPITELDHVIGVVIDDLAFRARRVRAQRVGGAGEGQKREGAEAVDCERQQPFRENASGGCFRERRGMGRGIEETQKQLRQQSAP